MRRERHFIFRIAWVLPTVLVLAGCSVQENPSGGVGQPQAEMLRPDLSQIAPDASARIEAAREALNRTLAEPKAGDEALALAFGRLGMLYHAYHFRNEAAFCYERARNYQPAVFRWHYLLARVYQNQTELDKAYELLLQALEIEPRHVPSLIAVGEYLRRRNRLDEARDYFSKAIEVQPGSAPALMGLAQIEIAEYRFAEALKWLDAALKTQPGAAVLHYQAALAYRGLGDLERANHHLALRAKSSAGLAKADALLDEIEHLRGESPGLAEPGDRAMAAGDFERAEREYRLVLADYPGNSVIRTKLGQALLRLGRLEPALAEFAAALKVEPDNANLHYNMGGMLMELGRFSQAADHFENCLELQPGMTEALLHWGDALRRGGFFEGAVVPYSKLMAHSPDDRGARLGLVFSLIRLARYDEAAKLLEEGLHQTPRDPILRHTLARVLATAPEPVRNGERASALVGELTATGMTLDLLETVAMIQAALGRFDLAIQSQRAALSIAEEQGLADRRNVLARNLERYRGRLTCERPWPPDAPVFTLPSFRNAGK